MSLFIKVYDNKFIPSLGRGPILKPVKVSEELYRTLRILGYTTEKINKNLINIKNKSVIEEVKEEVKEVKPEEVKEEVKEVKPEEVIEEVKEVKPEEVIEEVKEVKPEEVIESYSMPLEYKTEKIDYSQFSNSQLRNILKEHNIKFSNASSRDKLLELINANLS